MIVEVIIKDAPFSLNFSIFFDFFATSTRKINEMILPHVFFSPQAETTLGNVTIPSSFTLLTLSPMIKIPGQRED